MKKRILTLLLSMVLVVESMLPVAASETMGAVRETEQTGEQAETEETVQEPETETEETVQTPETETEETVQAPETETEETVQTPETGTEEIVQAPETETEETAWAQETETETEPAATEETEPDYALGVQPDTMETEGNEAAPVNLQIAEQNYGKIKLTWEIKNKEYVDDYYVYCNIYRAEQENGPYTLLKEREACYFGDTSYSYYDKGEDLSDEDGNNKIFYYKICVVNFSGNEAVEGAFSEIVTNKEMPYGELKGDYKGAMLVDADGSPVNSLTLHKGEKKQLSVVMVKKDGTKVPVTDELLNEEYENSGYVFWNIYHGKGSEKQEDGTSQTLQVLPVEFSQKAMREEWNIKLKGNALTNSEDPYYLSMQIFGISIGYVQLRLPVTVLEAEEGADYGEKELLFDDRQLFNEAIRKNLVNRTKKFTFYVEDNLFREWYSYSVGADGQMVMDKGAWGLDEVYDFCAEREGMKPNEGDYLKFAEGTQEVESLYTQYNYTGVYFANTSYAEITFTVPFITTKAQEDWVTASVGSIIHQPGGALYPYRDASEYDKIKAVYDYVRNNVSYIPSRTPIYHTCYSALYNKKATCEGYALLFYRLARELGIANKLIMGTDESAHAYNIVQLGNSWYYLDTNGGQFLKGEKDFSHSPFQEQWQNEEFIKNYLSKIPGYTYDGSKESAVTKILSLSDEEICALDTNLLAVSEKMAARYTISGTTVKAAGTLEYIEGCTGYLGFKEGEVSAGYFLSLKINADKSKFTEDGFLSVSYTQDGERQEYVYKKSDSTLKDGYLNMILKISDTLSDVKIKVDFDTDTEESEYAEKTYKLNLSNLKKEEKEKSQSVIGETGLYGVESSSPLISKNSDETQITALYEAVAYSGEVSLPNKEAGSGNYVALKIEAPRSIQNTAMLEGTTVTVGEAAEDGIILDGGQITSPPDCYVEKADNFSYLVFVMPVTKGFHREITIRWGGDSPAAKVQKLNIITPADCVLETLDERAVLPDSIAFNGLNKMMYMGQRQCIHITMNKKYEQDVTRLVYTSDNTDVLSVNRVTGVMKALKPGSAEITVAAIDKSGKTITNLMKKAKITVKSITAPSGIKVSSLKDKNAAVSWKSNTTGQYIEVYAIVLNTEKMGTKAAKWKTYIENALEQTGLNQTILEALNAEEKTDMLQKLEKTLGTGGCAAEYTKAENNSLEIGGLQAETDYVFYVRNVSKTAVSTIASAGNVSGRAATKSGIFAQVKVIPKNASGTELAAEEVKDGMPVFTVTQDKLAESGAPELLSYKLLNENGEEQTAEFTKISYKSEDKDIIKAGALDGKLTIGKKAGEVRLYVTGKDASGTVRESEGILLRVIKTPEALTDKTTTLTIGQSISIKELVGSKIKGSVEETDFSKVDFAALLDAVKASGCFAVSYKEGSSKDENGNYPAEDALLTAAAPAEKNGVRKSGNSVAFTVNLYSGGENSGVISSKKATVKINDMTQPVVKKITVKDTSAVIEFTPSSTVKEFAGSRFYYTAAVTDKVTGEVKETVTVTETQAREPLMACEIKGLSSNKAYEVQITAHFDADEIRRNEKTSKAKKFTTSKQLLASEGTIDIAYISLEELQENPEAEGTTVDYDDENGILLENNGTYVFMAKVSNLARALETDKLKWSISSGDKKAASIKATASTYEAKLTAAKTGTITITAVSTVTKEALATFKVTIIPYQSGKLETKEVNNLRESDDKL